MPRLIAISPLLAGSVHELGESWATVGRGDGNTFQIVESSVSGKHCEVRLRGEELVVHDLLSTNGTFIGGQKITEGVVKLGQTLRLGDVELRFEVSPAASSPGTTFTSKMLVTNSAATLAAKPAPVSVAKPEAAPIPAGEMDRKFHVLFVDDSMAFLELFSSLCEEYSERRWQIYTATAADKALVVLQDRPVDLVVLDVAMPMLDGLQLLGIIHRRYPGVKVAVMTGGATEAKRADALANGAELFLEKPTTADGMKSVFNVLHDLVSWDCEGFSGALRQVGLQEVIQMECNGRHSSILEIRNPELRGQIYIEAGAITHADIGTLVGEAAFYRLLALRGGEFSVKPFKAPPQRTIDARWEFLLMDAARATDEETVILRKPAAPSPTAVPPLATEGETTHIGMGDDIIVVSTYEAEGGKWNAADNAPK
jgi:CheY-like chemotaxis protein